MSAIASGPAKNNYTAVNTQPPEETRPGSASTEHLTKANENKHDYRSAKPRFEPVKGEPKAETYRALHVAPSLSIILMGWWEEIAWLLLCAGALIALAVVLDRYDGQPLPKWPSGLTLNTVIALISTVCRTAFIEPVIVSLAQLKWLWFTKRGRPLRDYSLLDDASRGPWGSLLLILKSKARFIGFLPAMIILSALATSTITQSAVAYPERPIELVGANNAVMNRSDSYFAATANTQSLILRTVPITAAVPRALYTPPEEQLLYGSPSCRSSNCTWEDFSTLSICFDMKNVTDQLKVDFDPGPPYQANLTLPNNITLRSPGSGYGDTMIESGTSLGFSKETDSSNSSLLSFFVLVYDPRSGPLRTRATEILLHWCVNTYTVDITDNIPTVNLVASSAQTEYGEAFIPGYNTTMNVTYLTTPNDPGAKYPADGNTIGIIQSTLVTNLEGQFTDYGGPQYNNGVQLFAAAMYPTSLDLDTDATMQDLDDAQWTAMKRMSSNLATSLSNMLANTQTHGQAWQMETFVSVRWPYLTFLMAQVLLSIITLIYIIIATANSGLEIIKTAPLPPLFAIPADEKLALESSAAVAAVALGEMKGGVGLLRGDGTGGGNGGRCRSAGLRRAETGRVDLWEIR